MADANASSRRQSAPGSLTGLAGAPHEARKGRTRCSPACPGRTEVVAYPGGMARAYDVERVERKWQRHWADEGTYQIDNDDPREKFYALCMYPYPSGPAHQGHVRNYTFGDLAVRYQTMQGKARPLPARVRLLRPAGGERRHQDGDPPPDLHRGPDRRAQVVPDPPRARSTTGGGRCAATIPSTSSGTS